MKISKRNLRRIIQEEKEKLLSEANPDGTISGDEEDLEDDLMMEIEIQIDQLIDHVKKEAYAIGGPFRGPGLKARAFKLLADKIHRAR